MTADSGASQQTSAGSDIDQTSTSETDGASNAGTSSGDSVPVGAIAGGVVGGVAVLAIAAGLITWLCLRHRRERRNNAAKNADISGTNGTSSPGGSGIARKPVPEQRWIPAELAHDQNYRPNEVVSNDKVHAHELLGRKTVPELP